MHPMTIFKEVSFPLKSRMALPYALCVMPIQGGSNGVFFSTQVTSRNAKHLTTKRRTLPLHPRAMRSIAGGVGERVPSQK